MRKFLAIFITVSLLMGSFCVLSFSSSASESGETHTLELESGKNYMTYAQTRTGSVGGTKDVRILCVANEEWIKTLSTFAASFIFTDGKETINTKSVAFDAIYKTITATDSNGTVDTYIAGEGATIFGWIITGVPDAYADIVNTPPQVILHTEENFVPDITPGEGDSDPEEPLVVYGYNFMSAISDNTPLSSITLPGTHDSGATHEMKVIFTITGSAKCQTLSIAEQLECGVRYFDIRLKRENGVLKVYHGIVDQKLTFDQVLTDFHNFLDENPTEALVVCIKEETDASGTNDNFDVMVKNKINANSSKWYTGGDIPTLGNVRGKCVLMRRFGTSGTYGFNADHDFADDNADFTITNGSYNLRVQDDYVLSKEADKWTAVESFFNKAMKNPASNTYYLCNTSGTLSGLSPKLHNVKNHVNPLLLSYLADKPSLTGIIATDYMTAEIAEAIWQLNFS